MLILRQSKSHNKYPTFGCSLVWYHELILGAVPLHYTWPQFHRLVLTMNTWSSVNQWVTDLPVNLGWLSLASWWNRAQDSDGNWLPNKHEILTQCCFNVGPASQMMGQHWNNTGSMWCLMFTGWILQTITVISTGESSILQMTIHTVIVLFIFVVFNLIFFPRIWI